MLLLRALPFLIAVLAAAQPLKKATFEEKPAIVASNDRIALTVLTTGASFADLVLLNDPDRMSPLWNPDRLAREGGQKPRFGASRGHFVCVDGFGPVSAEERAAGLEGHGEAHRQQMEIRKMSKKGRVATLTMSAKLPIVQEIFTRTVRIVDGENVVYVESELESLLGFDRPVNWAEHATVGSPFLEPGVTVVDLSGSRSRTRPYQGQSAQPRRLASGQDFTWPNASGRDGGTFDLRATPTKLGYLDHATTLMDPARKHVWVTALHPTKRLVLGYLFRREEYPWLQYWGNYPENGKLSRGLEFGTQPFDVPRREAISMGKLFDTPTYRWLPAKSKIQTRFLMFYLQTPEGMKEIREVALEGGQIVIRGSGLEVRTPASLGL